MKASSGCNLAGLHQQHSMTFIPSSLSIYATKNQLYYRAWLQDVQQLRQVEIAAAADDTSDLRANHQGNGFDAAFWIGDTICHYFDRLLCTCQCVVSCGITAQVGIKSLIYLTESGRTLQN